MSKKKKEKKEERFFGLRKSQFVVELDKKFFHHDKSAKHNDTTVCVIYFAFLTYRIAPMGITPKIVKKVERRFQGIKFNGQMGRGSAFLMHIKGKAEVSNDDTPNEMVGKDVAYSKCLQKAYQIAKAIVQTINSELEKTVTKNINVFDFLDKSLNKEVEWVKNV